VVAVFKAINRMLDGTTIEDGRVDSDYVAVTRAVDLLLIGVPQNANKEVIARFEERRFARWHA
jgi:hypothetical protein